MPDPFKFIRPLRLPDESPAAARDALAREHFDAVARHYDLANTIMSLGLHHFWKRQAVAILAPGPGWRLADVCGGTADLALLARRGLTTADRSLAVVYDLNRAMLDRGRAKAARRQDTGLVFMQGDAQNLALATGSMDAVMMGFGLRNLGDPRRGLEEAARVLKPGGKLMCLEFCQPPSRWFGALYDLYSWLLMPLVGRVFTGSWSTYSYLAGSIRGFVSPPELAWQMRDAGFANVHWRRLSGGIAAVHLAVRP